MSTLFVILCFRITTIYLNVNQASVEIEARGVPQNQCRQMTRHTQQQKNIYDCIKQTCMQTILF